MITSPIKTMSDSPVTDKVISLQAVGKKYPLMKHAPQQDNFADFWALKDISFDIPKGEVLGIIGRNGAGKTTLLNIIAGTLSATSGKVITKGKVRGLFNLGVGFQDELTGGENIFLNGAIIGASRKEIEANFNKIVEFSELGNFINIPLGTYSQGMRLRLAFSIIANLDFDILAIDEVLAVGDVLFQNKCFQRLMDFRRAGKTLIITTQGMDLIERLCDRVILLDHGLLLFKGSPPEGINRYRALLNTKRFFVGPAQKEQKLFENTKKWVEDISNWGNKLGTKEIVIDSVELMNKFGCKCNSIKSGEPLKIKVNFLVRNKVKNAHFGVALFRNDGVYCCGPNTSFDGYNIANMDSGRGWFSLSYKKVLLAPGEYRLSVAIWDKNETLAFDYHDGYYKLIIKGPVAEGKQLLNMPFKIKAGDFIHKFIALLKHNKCVFDLGLPTATNEKFPENKGIKIESVRLLDSRGEEKNVFMTNQPAKLCINFSDISGFNKDSCSWVGLYRDDEVYCQGIATLLGKNKDFSIFFPKLPLLPGGYRVSAGIWDNSIKKFLIYEHGIYAFKMVFNHQDHGTVYLEHKWEWNFKKTS